VLGAQATTLPPLGYVLPKVRWPRLTPLTSISDEQLPAHRIAEATLELPEETPLDMAIMGNVSVGTPPQFLTVILDSGSPDLWLPSSSCAWCHRRAVPGNRFFQAHNTSSLQVMRKAAAIHIIEWATHRGMCLDVADGKAINGNGIQLWSRVNTNQVFALPISGLGAIRWAKHPDMCLDVAGGSPANGNPVQLWECLNDGRSPNQIFRLPARGSGMIRWAAHPEKCIDVSKGSNSNGTRIQLWDCSDIANQNFTFLRSKSKMQLTMRNIFFGSGRVEGVVVRDTVKFAGIKISRQPFLLVRKEQFAPPEHVWDGILGLAKGDWSVVGSPLFGRLKQQGIEPIFAFVPVHSGSQVKLRIGSEAFKSAEIAAQTLAWVPSSSAGLWYVDGMVGVHGMSKRTFLVDTGTTVLGMPQGDFAQLVKAIQPRRGCLFSRRMRRASCACSDISGMPPLRFRFGHVTLDLGAVDLFMPTSHVMGDLFRKEPACELQVDVRRAEAEWILGDNFLRKVVIVLDFQRQRVGFAAPTHQSSTEMRVVNKQLGGAEGKTVQTRVVPHPTKVDMLPTGGVLVQLSLQQRLNEHRQLLPFIDAIAGVAGAWAWTPLVASVCLATLALPIWRRVWNGPKKQLPQQQQQQQQQQHRHREEEHYQEQGPLLIR